MPSPDNPLFAPSDLAYNLPPFDRIRDEHYLPAFERGMTEQLAEIETIAESTEPPTIENTLVALERSGRLLERVSAVFFNKASSDTNPTVQQIQADIAPKLAAHSDAIFLDTRLFKRLESLVASRDQLDIDAETARLLDRYHTDFVRAGARLGRDEQQQLREINEELSALSTTFQQNLHADTNELAVVVDDVADLDGLSPDAVASAAEAANARGLEGKYVLELALPSGQPALTSLTNRSVRERLLRASLRRGNNDNDYNNAGIATRMATLRARRAALLGYAHHAAYTLADNTAKDAATLDAMLGQLVPAAMANADAEAAALQDAIDADGGGFGLKAWDWAFYSERVRRQRFDVDAAALRPYLELERVLGDGIFFAAKRLYGLDIRERFDLPGYHPDVRVFEVFDRNGSPLGLFLGDYFARPSKRGGAWMNSFVEQSELLDTKPVVINNLNVPKPPAGEPALLSFDEVNTAFHEFGHALHGLFSAVRYPRFSGTSVRRDFVEYPSQVNEMWAVWPEVLSNYARHHQTGEALPQDLLDRLLAAQQWGEGFKTTEYLAAALLDQAWHRITAVDAPGETAADAETFEANALARAGVRHASIPPRYRSTYFAHIFAGGYGAGYYSYIWSEVLDADTVEWFKENGGLRRENGDRFRQVILSRGGSVDEMAAFRKLRGRDPRIEPLLARRGLDG